MRNKINAAFTYRNHWLAHEPGSPNWYIYWRPPHSRRVYRRSTRTANLEMAKELLVGFAGGVGPGIAPTPKGHEWLRLDDALLFYTIHMKNRPSAPLVEAVRRHIRAFSQRHGIEYVNQFTPDVQDRYIAERRREALARDVSLSSGTINRDLDIIQSAFHYAYKCDRLAHVPFVQKLPMPPPRTRVLSLVECRRLLDACRPQPHLHLFVKLALYTLQRRSALLGLKTEQVDLVKGRINFHPPGKPVTTKRYPVVPIAKGIWRDLAIAIRESRTGHIIERKGQPLKDPKTGLATASKKARITPAVTPQVLRRTAATLLAGAGVPMREVAGMLGHSQLKTTERYAQHSPEYLMHAANALDDMLG